MARPLPWRAPAGRTPAACARRVALAIDLASRAVGAPCRSVSASASISCTIPASFERIVDAVAPAPGERIVEIGPGPRRPDLAAARARRDAGCDRDRPRSCASRCRPIRMRESHLRDPRARTCSIRTSSRCAPTARRCASSGNLPYNISTPLLFRLLAQRAAIGDMHVHAAERGGRSHGCAARQQGPTAG